MSELESFGQEPSRQPTVFEIQAAAKAKQERKKANIQALREGKKLEPAQPSEKPTTGTYSTAGNQKKLEALRATLAPRYPGGEIPPISKPKNGAGDEAIN